MPPEKHISVPKEELRLALKNRMELSDRAHFDDLVKLMEGIAAFDFVDLKHRMRSNFTPFAAAAAAAERGAHSDAELDTKVSDEQGARCQEQRGRARRHITNSSGGDAVTVAAAGGWPAVR
jgi:hypothetical protein